MINEKEMVVLSVLRQNSRMSLANISRKTRIPISTVFDILRKQEKNYINKHTSLLNYPRLGYHVRVNFALEIGKENEKNLLEFLDKNEKVNSIQKIRSGLYLEVIFKSMNEYAEFSERLDDFQLKQKKEIHIIEDLKREEFMAN